MRIEQTPWTGASGWEPTTPGALVEAPQIVFVFGSPRVLTDPRGISGAFLPLSVAEDLEKGAVPDGTQAFPGTRGTAVSQSANPVDEFWNQRPSIRPLTPAGARAIDGFGGASAENRFVVAV